MQGLVTVGVYKDVDVSAEIDGLSNMQDIAEAEFHPRQHIGR